MDGPVLLLDDHSVCQLCGNEPLERFEVPDRLTLWKCGQCGLYQHGRVAPSANYDSAYHVGYSKRRNQKLRTAIVRLNRIGSVSNVKKPRLLDVGCSLGYTVEAAQARGWDSVGVDISVAAVAVCRRHGLRCIVVQGDGLPFDDATFDVLTAWHVIEHVADVRKTLAEWGRVVRPGGLMVLETPDASSPKVRALGSAYRHFWAPEHTYTFTPNTLGVFVQQAGFELLQQPVFGRLSELPVSQAVYAFAYQTYQALRCAAGVHKAFQLFARRVVNMPQSGAPTRAA